jgi:CTP:molybdopterin cytidylyltransferase MocA
VKPRAVILAAGESRRMKGQQKLLMHFRDIPMIEYAIRAASEWDPLVIASPAVAAYLGHRKHLAVLINEHPERGMSHSLRIADNALPGEVPLLVLLGDKPLVTPGLIRAVCEASAEADIAHPECGGEPGHPVFFSWKARGRIAALPAGDSLRLLRNDPQLRHVRVESADEGAYFDINTPGAADLASE